MATMRSMIQFFRANPQALVLAAICLVLGIGTFVAVVVALGAAGGGAPTGDPSGAILLAFPFSR